MDTLVVTDSVPDAHSDPEVESDTEWVGVMEVVSELDWVLLRVAQLLTDPVAV